MNSTDFNHLYGSTELHDFVNAESRRYSKRPELQEEYQQESWMAISLAQGNLPITEYHSLISQTMYSSYWQNRKEVLSQRAVIENPESQELKESFDWVEEMEISTV